MRDLGVIMDPKLKFLAHHEYIINKSMSILGFIRRQCRNQLDKSTAAMLYFALVRSNLEFGSIIWSPYQSSHKKSIESVQKQAVMFLHNDYIQLSANNFTLRPYNERCQDLEISTLIRRRVNASVLFVHNILSGRIQSPLLRNDIQLNNGTRTIRRPEYIRFKTYRTDHSQFAPFNTACRAFNHAALMLDPTLPTYEFKRELKKLPDEIFGDLLRF